jgi:hypothetical protein
MSGRRDGKREIERKNERDEDIKKWGKIKK